MKPWESHSDFGDSARASGPVRGSWGKLVFSAPWAPPPAKSWAGPRVGKAGGNSGAAVSGYSQNREDSNRL